jgi:hypothetical protein
VPNDGWFPEELLRLLSAAAGGVRSHLQEIDEHSDHPMRNGFESAMRDIPSDVLDHYLADPVCAGWIRIYGAGADSRKARFEVLAAFMSDEIYARRSTLLRSVGDRPAPYEHPAVADLRPDRDLLVPLGAFDCRLGHLLRNGYIFSAPPPLRSPNSDYWSTQALLRLPAEAVARVRLDPLRVSPVASYHGPLYRMRVFGRDLDWRRLSDLRGEEAARWMPDELTTAECEFTDLVWRSRLDGVHFECEEVPKRSERRPSRYFHAIYQPTGGYFSHADAAVRYYTAPELESRRKSHVKALGKVGARVKLLRVDGVLGQQDWATLLASFFVWNNDVARYVTGERDFFTECSLLMSEQA